MPELTDHPQRTTPVEESAQLLAEARNESLEAVLSRFGRKALERLPRRFSKHLKALRAASLTATGVRDGLAWATLDNGRIFYSPISHAALKREYHYIADTLPYCITADTYLAAIDVVQRYLTDFTWPPHGLCRSGAANIIELGAYLGHKTVRFAEELAKDDGKVLAVEMMPANCEILRRNVVENGLEGVIEIREVGVWNEPGAVRVFSKGRQRVSILPIENLQNGNESFATVDTLDKIIDQWNVYPIDLVFITVNGAEIEALHGFHPEGRDVRAIFVAAPYERDGRPNYEVCRELLVERGYELVDVGNPHRVVGKRPAGQTPYTAPQNGPKAMQTAFELDLDTQDQKQLCRHLRVVPRGRRPPNVVGIEQALRTGLLQGEVRRLIDTQFRSQFRFSRILHTVNILNDFFNQQDFADKRVADFGPGQFAFALLARDLGAEVVAVDKNEPFLSVAALLSLDVVATDYYAAPAELFGNPFDGLWLKGSFSALLPGGKENIDAFAKKLTGWITPAGWGYVAPNNRTSKFMKKFGTSWESQMAQLVEYQRVSMERLGWQTYTLREDDKRRYGMSSEAYDGSRYIFFRNLP